MDKFRNLESKVQEELANCNARVFTVYLLRFGLAVFAKEEFCELL